MILPEQDPRTDSWKDPWKARSRGTCPACGSREVRHTVYGMPSPQAYDSAPSWIDFGGCCPVVGGNRSCETCQSTWTHLERPGDGADPRRTAPRSSRPGRALIRRRAEARRRAADVSANRSRRTREPHHGGRGRQSG